MRLEEGADAGNPAGGVSRGVQARNAVREGQRINPSASRRRISSWGFRDLLQPDPRSTMSIGLAEACRLGEEGTGPDRGSARVSPPGAAPEGGR